MFGIRFLPLFGLIALAQDLVVDTCESSLCPQVKCPTSDLETLCRCITSREILCQKRCPNYVPDYQNCQSPPAVAITQALEPIVSKAPQITTYSPSVPTIPTAKPITCECPQVYCIQMWPAGCHCANGAAQKCYDECGGPPPKLQDCSTDTILTRTPALNPEMELPRKPSSCQCESTMCVQSWPDSCYCENAAAEACHRKCKGPKPQSKKCPPTISKTLRTSTRTPLPQHTTVLPSNPHKVCGGGRSNYQECEDGSVCITDPYTPGCGPACDGLGICVQDKMCGGFAGFRCDDPHQVCHDDPRDQCDPQRGGADCGGLCLWPHRSLYEDVV